MMRDDVSVFSFIYKRQFSTRSSLLKAGKAHQLVEGGESLEITGRGAPDC